ncbi:hypothetical protein EI983_15995 [Roseovarius faecimaris]|uniref:Chemotaxis protein n=1 Tax=Roseovarius faecimaris TaxID=2494550 RepID=A0A6I6ISK3_9RHOB|nr:hypothetical protein [Roseovarius faecimaris]QGX99685.1 hypothetical protein EI983_15995 [Roseovarius faecimaris]
MKSRPTGDILGMLAEEVQELASIAHCLDLGVSDMDLSGVDLEHLSDLQRVDALHQHLDDLAVILRRMVTMVGPGPELDLTELGSGVRLDYIRARLADRTPVSLSAPDQGAVELF